MITSLSVIYLGTFISSFRNYMMEWVMALESSLKDNLFFRKAISSMVIGEKPRIFLAF